MTQSTPHTEFPILDAARPVGNTEHHRAIIDVFGYAEPYIEELDGWTALPVRLVHDAANGWGIELGPYSLDAGDILLLRRAIAAYYAAMGRGA